MDEKALTKEDFDARLKELNEQRARDDKATIANMEAKPRCGILPSPDILDIPSCEGVDKTGTQEDFVKVWDFAQHSGFLNTGFTKHDISMLRNGAGSRKMTKDEFGPLVDTAYKLAFDPLRNTSSFDKEELVFFYYAGHGLSENFIEQKKLEKLPVPEMPNLTDKDYFDSGNVISPARNLKGGELYLHHRGFCDLRGLLRPFIAALESNVGQHPKKNKHLVIVVDSCYSGVLADDLRKMEDDQELKQWLDRGCSITVQASCGSNEPTFGGYFTPSFVCLNADEERLANLLAEWNSKSADEREKFLEDIGEDLPSPTVYATSPKENNDNPFMKIEKQNSTITLFNNPDFFKFCFIDICGQNISEPRALSVNEKEAFLNQASYTIIDFRLKTYKESGPFENSPMGLFLAEYSNDENKAVCVHVHYTEPNDATTFKLFEHVKKVTLYKQVGDGSEQYPANIAGNLIAACKSFVETKHPHAENTNFEDWWTNVDNWNMSRIGFCKKFRKTQRTLWLENALKFSN